MGYNNYSLTHFFSAVSVCFGGKTPRMGMKLHDNRKLKTLNGLLSFLHIYSLIVKSYWQVYTLWKSGGTMYVLDTKNLTYPQSFGVLRFFFFSNHFLLDFHQLSNDLFNELWKNFQNCIIKKKKIAKQNALRNKLHELFIVFVYNRPDIFKCRVVFYHSIFHEGRGYRRLHVHTYIH